VGRPVAKASVQEENSPSKDGSLEECGSDLGHEKSVTEVSVPVDLLPESSRPEVSSSQSPVVSSMEQEKEVVGANCSTPVSGLCEKNGQASPSVKPIIGLQQMATGAVQDWRKLFKTGHSGSSLQFFDPSRRNGRVTIQPPREAVVNGVEKWSSALIGQFLDKPLPFYVVKRSVEKLWDKYGSVDVSLMENGLFLFWFKDEQSREAVLEEKLWYVANKPLILRKWVPGMQLLKLSLASIPIWIKLHHIPLEYWNTICLSHIASGVGKPICTDAVTSEHSRLGFARILVEVDIEDEFPKEIDLIGLDGEVIKIGIEYPWIPIRCKNCSLFGHATHTCTKIEKPLWFSRKQEPVEVPRNFPNRVEQVRRHIDPGVSKGNHWTVVKSRKTPKKIVDLDNSHHWSNSFQLIASAGGQHFDQEAVQRSNLELQQELDEMGFAGFPTPIDKGKGKLEEEEDGHSRGVTPHS
jgi:hypothetical protein